MSKKCDHTSVGMLVFRADKLLLVERKRPPLGFAPPAGHVDERSSFREAAIAELQEEVGLSPIGLDLITEGRKENECRRQEGDWHYWRVYRTTSLGHPIGSEDETKSIRWASIEELQGLADRTELYITGSLSHDEWENSPGLEPVWCEWLAEIGLIRSSTNVNVLTAAPTKNENLAAAREYAWSWFVYHAGQRLTVFRFFLIIVAVISTGYLASFNNKFYGSSIFLSAILFFISILFWRLDIRNLHLVKIAELYLKKEEQRLSENMGVQEIRFSWKSDQKPNTIFTKLRIYSFKEIYRYIFVLTSIGALAAIGISVYEFISSLDCPRGG